MATAQNSELISYADSSKTDWREFLLGPATARNASQGGTGYGRFHSATVYGW
jgi:hypothetical protein